MKRKALLFISCLLLVSLTSNAQISEAVGFFAYNICGTGQTVSWRGSCHTSDNPAGGYHDAGDHVKFNLPLAFTASFLAWADYEYGAPVGTPVSRILSYLGSCGTTVHAYQVGNAGADHAYWGPPENQTGTRPTYTSGNVSCVQAGAAAAFAAAAAAGLNGGSTSMAGSFLSAAENSMSDSGYTEANGFYTSFSGFYDELAWACIWLYLAGAGDAYLTKAENYVPYMNTDWLWTHCWDDKGYGVYLKLAQITRKAEYIQPFEAWLDWWNGGINHTSAGLPWLDAWGSLRYASATAFLAKLWADSDVCTPSKVSGYHDLSRNILSYIRGNNPRNGSYIIGYGSNWPRNPHHRAACPSKINGDCSYTLYGALVGGPDLNDNYVDDLNQYQYTEVAMDYNACLIGLLASESGSPQTYAPTPPPTPSPSPGPTAQPGSGNGLLGNYYRGMSFNILDTTRTDAVIDFNWGGGSPLGTNLSVDGFSVRWTGRLEPIYTDTYTIYENSDDGCRVIIDNTTVIDQWNDEAAAEYSGTINLNAGQLYDITVEFYENTGDASIQLSWSSSYQAREIIPQNRLYSSGGITSAPTPTPELTPAPTAVPTATPAPYFTPVPTTVPTSPPSGGVITSADFENGFGEWENVSGDTHDWTRNSGGTPSTSTGPSTGADGSTWYVYLETSSGGANSSGNTAFLEGPGINASGCVLTFSYHMYGSDIGTLHVDVYSNGYWNNGIWSRTGQQHTSNSAAYTRAMVDLGSYSSFIVRFRAVAAGSYRGDIAIDDIEIAGSGTVTPDGTPIPTPTPIETAAPTATPVGTSVPTAAPTATPVGTSVPTAAPTATPVPTAAPTPPPSSGGCTCQTGCSSATSISPDFTRNGPGEYCWEATSLGNYINSWNLAVLEVNGVDFTNTYVHSSHYPAPVNGIYYVYYRGNYGWSHFEARN